MRAHSKFPPSAALRSLNCPPSLLLGEQFEDEESVYAAEGTAGHALAEHLIKKYLKQRTRRPTSDFYTDELIEAVEEYVTFVKEQVEDARRVCQTPLLSVEQRVDVSEYVAGCFGTADMMIVTDSVAHIIDLKLGRGVMVDAEENPQLMIYGLGVLAIGEMLYSIDTVRMTIYQPRLEHISTWEISAQKLKQWGDEVLRPRGAMALNGEGDFCPGEWCRFCKARNTCRARAQGYLKLAEMEFRDPPLLTDDEISEVLKVADDLAKWAADVYAFAQDTAVTYGKHWPGYKLVEGRSNRRYSDEDAVIAAATEAGYTDIFKKSLIGITEMEKLMGKQRFAEVIGPLVYKPQGKITLVPETDKREAIKRTTAEADFMEEQDNEK